MRTITFIIIHCSGTKVSSNYSFEQCKSDHINGNKWDDIGYHWYIEKDGKLHQGRDESIQGAHCKRHNPHSIGVCYEGGLNSIGSACDTRTEAQKSTLLRLITELHTRYPKAIILGHRDLSTDLNNDGRITPDEYIKCCPCFNAMVEYSDLQPSGFWDGKPIFQ